MLLYVEDEPFSVTSIDLEEVEKVKLYYWYLNAGGYVEGVVEGRHTRLHRYLLNPSENESIDHISDELYGDKRLDNRKTNLRICNQSQNMMNRDKDWNKKSSIYKDVYKSDVGHYRVVISRVDYGTYTCEHAAGNAYNYYVEGEHGEFSHFIEVPFMEKEEWISYRRTPNSPALAINSRNTSGYTGVRLNKGSWISEIAFEGKAFYIGTFSNEKDAYRAKLEADKIKLKHYPDIEKCKKEISKLNPVTTKSGVKGVTWSKVDKVWIVRIQVDGKRMVLGRYEELKDATNTRKSAERDLKLLSLEEFLEKYS